MQYLTIKILRISDLGSQTNESNLPDELIMDNTVYDSHNDIADPINNFFANIRDRVVIEDTRYNIQETLFYVGLEQQLTLACKLFSDKQSRNVKQG